LETQKERKEKEMKKAICVLIILIASFVYIGISHAEEKPPEYRLEVKIVYNSVDADKLSDLIEQIAQKHGKACQVKFDVKKVDNSLITFSTGTNIILTPYGNLEAN
jgi:hypothetical protein